MTERTDAAGVALGCRSVVHIYPARAKGIDAVVALTSVDLDVAGGELVALLGPSGSGKSTVLGLLAGILRPSAGRVFVGEHDLTRLPPRELARLRGRVIGTVLQDPSRNVVPYATVRQNVRLASGSRAREADDLLDRLGMAPLGRQTAGRLSAGEQQRVGIAAAVAGGARVLLADEPTSHLDPAGRRTVLDLLTTVNAELGATVVVVTHDAAVAERVPRTVTIRDGRVGAEGRSGTDYAVVAPDGTIQLPPAVLERFGPGTLLRVVPHPSGVDLQARADDGEDDR